MEGQARRRRCSVAGATALRRNDDAGCDRVGAHKARGCGDAPASLCYNQAHNGGDRSPPPSVARGEGIASPTPQGGGIMAEADFTCYYDFR